MTTQMILHPVISNTNKKDPDLFFLFNYHLQSSITHCAWKILINVAKKTSKNNGTETGFLFPIVQEHIDWHIQVLLLYYAGIKHSDLDLPEIQYVQTELVFFFFFALICIEFFSYCICSSQCTLAGLTRPPEEMV